MNCNNMTKLLNIVEVLFRGKKTYVNIHLNCSIDKKKSKIHDK